MSRIKFKQPNGYIVTMDIFDESKSCYTSVDFKKDPALRGTFSADLFIETGHWDSFRYSYQMTDKKFWFDDKGIYTYPKQKKPFYYWTPQNIEEDYDNWSKDKSGYSIPLNEPRKIKKNYF